MYFIKEIITNRLNNTIEIVNGIKTYKIGDKYVAGDDFWGKTELLVGTFADEKKFTKYNDYLLIPYTNSYNVKDIDDGYKQLDFNISTLDLGNIEGYIVIIKYDSNIKTNGEVLFRRYPSEIMVVLREGEFLEVFDKVIKVVDNKLQMEI